MIKVAFKQQMYFGLAIVLLGFVLSTLFSQGMFLNTGQVLYGLLFIINPVFPTRFENIRGMKLYIRLAGLIVVALGLITRFGV